MTRRSQPIAPYARIRVTYKSGREEVIPCTREQLEPTKRKLNNLPTVDFFKVL